MPLVWLRFILYNLNMLFLFLESTRRRAYGLVAQAYTSISAEDFASFVGYSVEEAVKGKITLKAQIQS